MVKNLPVGDTGSVQDTSQEDPLEKGMATHSSILAQKIPRTEEPGDFSPWGCKELATIERQACTHTCTCTHTHTQWNTTQPVKMNEAVHQQRGATWR